MCMYIDSRKYNFKYQRFFFVLTQISFEYLPLKWSHDLCTLNPETKDTFLYRTYRVRFVYNASLVRFYIWMGILVTFAINIIQVRTKTIATAVPHSYLKRTIFHCASHDHAVRTACVQVYPKSLCAQFKPHFNTNNTPDLHYQKRRTRRIYFDIIPFAHTDIRSTPRAPLGHMTPLRDSKRLASLRPCGVLNIYIYIHIYTYIILCIAPYSVLIFMLYFIRHPHRLHTLTCT